MDRFNFSVWEKVETNPFIGKIGYYSLVILVAFIAILFLPWRQTISGEGRLIAYDPVERIQSISAPIDGFISNIYVNENEQVKEGTGLFSMVDLDSDYKVRLYKMKKDFEKQIKNINDEFIVLEDKEKSLLRQIDININIYDNRKIQIKENLKGIKFKYKAEIKNYYVLSNQYERIKELYTQKIESKKSFEKSENDFVGAKNKVEKNKIDQKVQEQNLLIINKEQEQFEEEMDNKIRTVKKNMLSVKTHLNKAQREYDEHLTKTARYETSMVNSKKDGVVMRVLENDKNTYIKKGQPIIMFSPEVTQTALLLKISDFNMPLVKEGLKVRVRFHGWPVVHIPGWPEVRIGTFGGIIKRVDPVLYENNTFYAYVVEDPSEPWPDHKDLKIGTNATAWVGLSTVTIWYELWRLMNAFPANMVTPGKE